MRLTVAALVVIGSGCIAACGSTTPTQGTGVATNPPPGTAHAGSGVAAASGTRTVLTPLGLNVRATPSKEGARLGNAAQGTTLTVLDRATDANRGEWFKVQGASVTGWISADRALSSPHHFSVFPQDQHDFSALYLDTWTFAEQDTAVVFRPQTTGTQTIVVTTAASDAALGPAGHIGYRVTTYDNDEVCGATTTLRNLDRIGSPAPAGTPSAGATPAPATPLLAHLAQLRLPVDATHALGVDFMYDDPGQIADFTDFVNSMSFPSPLCRGPTPAPPSSSATPPA